MVRPLTVTGLSLPAPGKPPGFEVTVYPVIAEPSILAGAVNVSVACALPAVAVPIVGAPDTAKV
ncbi:MAG TPA: hypothetical protein VMV47_17960 [Bacteroidales bacterium]|nr:hypothetical protein [Bacteroidales bacterium]